MLHLSFHPYTIDSLILTQVLKMPIIIGFI
nr:MAG TPA: N-terminal domain of CBF1 interacting co-repressor CIR [Caudoviricetes sp.]